MNRSLASLARFGYAVDKDFAKARMGSGIVLGEGVVEDRIEDKIACLGSSES